MLADLVKARIASYRELGAAFKAVNDGLRGSELQTVLLVQSARQIRNAAPCWARSSVAKGATSARSRWPPAST